jgi:hypothetical protein
MALISINWRPMDAVAPTAASTGEDGTDATARNAMRLDRQMMVYVVADDATNKLTRKLEDVVFANEQLGIGTKFFDTVKVTNGNALQDRILKDAGKSSPRLVFVTRDYKVHAVMEKSKLSAGKILKAMKALAKVEYKSSFEKMVREYTKLLNELDRLEGKKAQLADMQARLQAKPSPSKQKKLERERKKYEKAMEDWRAREKKCLTFKPKAEKKPEA